MIPLPMPPRRGALWLSLPRGSNEVLDAPMRRFLFTRMPTAVVLNGEQGGYGNLVEAIRSEFPAIKVLRYANAQRVPEGTRVASTMFPHFLANAASEALVLSNTGRPKIGGLPPDRTIWTDITLRATRDFIVAHLAEQVAALGVDGVAIDSFHAGLTVDQGPSTEYVGGRAKARAWPAACARLLRDLRAALPGKLLWFNGIWSFEGQRQVDAQSALLHLADGASVEFYGYDGRRPEIAITTNTFAVFVRRVNTVLAAHPGTSFLVHGTSANGKYFDYRTDLQQARYCYGCYLLGKTPRSSFTYGQSFQLMRLPGERTGGAAMFSYFDLPLGDPTGPAIDDGRGTWSREYQGGRVFVAPAEGGAKRWKVTTDSWTTLGAKCPAGSTLTLPEGDAAILLLARPAPPRSPLDANIGDSTREWLVDGVTGEYRYRFLTLRVCSTDSRSAVLVRFETDDCPRPFGILEVLPEVAPGDETFDPGHSDYPYGCKRTLGAAHVRSAHRYPTHGDGSDAWTELTIDLEEECAPFPCFRVISVRAIGSVKVGLIRLTGPVPITAPGLRTCPG